MQQGQGQNAVGIEALENAARSAFRKPMAGLGLARSRTSGVMAAGF